MIFLLAKCILCAQKRTSVILFYALVHAAASARDDLGQTALVRT